jgi:Predicted Zn-dependent protease (DUF2268)
MRLKRSAVRLVLSFAAFAVATSSAAPTGAAAADSQPSVAPVIHIEDVDRFYKLYDATGGHPTVEQLQHDYLDLGSEGLHHLAEVRNVTAQRMADSIAKNAELYSDARRCMAVLPRAREREIVALQKLRELYPEARLLPVTIAVGRGKPVAIGSPAYGVQIGLEALCGVKYFDANAEDRFVHVIAHEYVHVQQVRVLVDEDHPTVLVGSLVEGAADFVGEMISGGVSNSGLYASTVGHEKEIETAFVPDEDKTDLTKWLYNGTMDKSGDLGYWVGYRIVKSYYQHAPDKRAALREILQMSDPHAFLAKSGWYPGMQLR